MRGCQRMSREPVVTVTFRGAFNRHFAEWQPAPKSTWCSRCRAGHCGRLTSSVASHPGLFQSISAHDERDRAGVRHRPPPEFEKGCVTRRTMLYKMGMSAEQSWRRLRGFRQLGKVIEGVKFKDGIEDSRAVA